MTSPLLEIDRLRVRLPVNGAHRTVLHEVSLSVAAGEAVGLVGESGSGKSMTARAVMRLLPPRAEVSGDIRFAGASVPEMGAADLRRLRADDVAMIFQDPRAHINPVHSIGDFLTESLRLNGKVTRSAATARVVALLKEVGISDAERRLRQHPHELSGGLLQRVMIAAALVAEPRLILADEPTTALDVTTQEEVMAILDELRRDRGLAMLFITHDLELAAAVCDRIGVMYAGSIVEDRDARELHERSGHPYTVGLLGARPDLLGDRAPLVAVPGRPLSAYEVGDGCAFRTRCELAQPRCGDDVPQLREIAGGSVACHFAEQVLDSRKVVLPHD
ncbi:ABC transporter ATP-binding protein [Aeromicrobium endophyticum]|uniref:ABC transporter ATP-binding protein n=1 Tax=Aeromicrobium endophyticum TaxID=2292704 RepID=A0A371PDM1_9ACTN|nr:ABC transporter ATP-binding protein [Aeromicrobium endophyticum]REK73608.1 ABC transporter ATP-binding protein [Aeromicrobium endophyticum]